MPEITLEFESARALDRLLASNTANLKETERRLGVSLTTREGWLQVESQHEEGVEGVKQLFAVLKMATEQGVVIKDNDFKKILTAVAEGKGEEYLKLFEEPLVVRTKNLSIVPRTVNQKRYLRAIQKFDIVFGVGPAGTGKTFLAVAAAMEALAQGTVEKVILTRPAVEAGEALGFLPGDLTEKIQPYLRPLYDALNVMQGKEAIAKLSERGILEIAPLAYMRGRTLSNAFIILDEAQNTTPEQMMMFLTRLGEGSRMVITGDITQVDLPKSKSSGLKQAAEVLINTEGIKFFFLDSSDVVRHVLVQRIIDAYDRFHNPGYREERD